MHERIGGENGIWGKLDDKNTGNSVRKWKSGINNSAEIFLGDKIMPKCIKSTVSLLSIIRLGNSVPEMEFTQTISKISGVW